MLWPTPADYVQAVDGYPDVCLLDPELRGGKPKKTPANQLLVYTGGFSTVFPIETAHDDYALRCWNKDIGDSKNRYEKTDNYLTQVQLPYFVDFEYVPEGILINGKKWPITRMEWANGESLRDFIEHNLHDPKIFGVVADEFRKMFETLHANQISHGDLQSGNIMLRKNGSDIIIKLIDYDSFFVPALRGQKSPTPGLPEYQHPSRIDKCDEKMDYFSELVIYLSFFSLSEKPELWNQFKDKTEKGLLFSKEDFEKPDQSNIFQELENLSPGIQQLAATLKDFCAKTSIDQLQPLEAILPKPDANTHTNHGFILLNDKLYDEALAEFQKAIVINPNYKKAFYGFGLAYLHSKRYTEAIDAFEQAISKDPNYKEAHHGLGLIYYETGDYSKAESAANAALKIDLYYHPARQLLDAIKSATTPPVMPPPTGSGSGPNPPPPKPGSNVWRNLTVALGLASIICIAVLIWQTDIINRIFPQGAVVENQSFLKETETRQVESENPNIPSLVKTQEKDVISPENDGPQNQLKDSTSTTDTPSKNVVSLRKQLSEQKDENRKLQNQLAKQDTEIRQLRQDKTEALSENLRLRNVLEGDNSNPTNENTTVHQLLKDKTEALSENKRLQKQNESLVKQNEKLQNENKTLLSQLNEMKQQNSDPISESFIDQELTELYKTIKTEPPKKIQDYRDRNVIIRAGSHNNQGYIDFNSNDFDEALKQFERAIKVDSKFAIAHYNLGCTYLAMKEYPKAVNALNKTVALDLNFKEAYYNRGIAYVNMKMFKNAKQSFEKTLSIDANHKPTQKLLEAIEKWGK